MSRVPPTALLIALTLPLGCSVEEVADSAAVRRVGPAGSASGRTLYEDGQNRAASPPTQTAQLEVVLTTQADYWVEPSECKLDMIGHRLLAHLDGEVFIDAEGNYVGGLVFSAYETPTGCAVTDPVLSAVDAVAFTARLDDTEENCASYCEAKGRAAGDDACDGRADEESCRASVELNHERACRITCTERNVTIVAEASLTAEETAQVSAEWQATESVGELRTRLRFDHLVTAGGTRIADDGQ